MQEEGLVIVRVHAPVLAAVIAVVLALAGSGQPAFAATGDVELSAAVPDGSEVTASLDGKPIPLSDVSKYYCDDFAFPVIRCSVSPLVIQTRATLVALLSSVDYVTIFDQISYAGAFMNVSQDYTVLATIGWNDRISSFKARNSETGRFWTDWFYTGTTWSFCCNQQASSLGSYDNTFSSVQRT
jgi:hypothetical protein